MVAVVVVVKISGQTVVAEVSFASPSCLPAEMMLVIVVRRRRWSMVGI